MGFLASLALALLECFRRRHSKELSSTNPAKPSEPKTSEESKTPIKNSKKPPTFKLLKLPWVAFNEVVKSMDPRDVFLMSLCSENTFTILKTWRTKVKWLCYIVDGNDLCVFGSQSYNKNDSSYLARTVSEFDKDVENQQQFVRVRIGGMDVQCLWKTDCIEFVETSGDVTQKAMSRHIHELFNAECIDLEMTEKDIVNKEYPNMLKVTDLMLYEATISPSDLEEILEKYPNLKTFRIKGHINGIVSANSQIFNIERILLHSYNQPAPFIWKNFNGRCAFLGQGEYSETDIVEFVYDWISGTRYPKLEIILVMNSNAVLDFEQVWEELEPSTIEEWNCPSIDDRWKREKPYGKSILKFKSQEFMDFERETDHKMASLLTLSTGGFCFIVWN